MDEKLQKRITKRVLHSLLEELDFDVDELTESLDVAKEEIDKALMLEIIDELDRYDGIPILLMQGEVIIDKYMVDYFLKDEQGEWIIN